MNKRKLQEFATWAKLNLEKQIEISLRRIGINSETDIKRSRVQGDIIVIDGIETTFKKGFQSLREDIINRIKSDGFSHTIEQFASTWFNRIVALRFMEVHNYLDHGFKLFPTEPNTLPEILSKLFLVSEELKLDMVYCNQLLSSGNHNEELYRYVLFQQCNALAKPLPMLFSVGMSYLEYFIPSPLLFGDTIINKLIEIDKNDFKEDVEILGWLYQFYIANKKAEVFAAKKTITKDTLPAVTQLFTPDWIVKYMAENSIGRIWLESYPNSPIKTDMKYYVEEAEQEREVEEKLKEIRYKDINPEEIKIIEPCSGSGHILVYCFDLLVKMYVEKGYTKRDIPQQIFKNNLVGLDIDQRATQLASFALVMRARSIDNKFFDESRYVRPKIYEIIDSKAILDLNYNGKKYLEIIKEYNSTQWIGENQLSDDEIKSIEYVVDLFDDAKVIGSLLKVKPAKYLTIRKKLVSNERENTQPDIFTSSFFNREFKELVEILRLAYLLASKYDVMITNPPYQTVSNLEDKVKLYIKKNYPLTSTDLFAVFMSTNFVKRLGFTAMINQHQWMFTSSYVSFRKMLLHNNTVISLVHLGTRAFEEISGEKVQSVSFISRNILSFEYKSTFFRLVSLKRPEDKEKEFINRKSKGYNLKYIIVQDRFLEITDSPFAYWISESIISTFSSKNIGEYGYIGKGLDTCNQDRFERLWYEVSIGKISFDSTQTDCRKWYIFSKGGGYRRWYGNLMDIVLWENKGYEIRNYRNPNGSIKSRPQNVDKYFRKCVTWSSVGTGLFGARIIENAVFGNGSALFVDKSENNIPILALLNSKVVHKYLSFLSPTLTFNAGDLSKIPVVDGILNNDYLNKLTNENIDISKIDWDSYETSMDFTRHNLVHLNSKMSLEQVYKYESELTLKRFENLRINEYKINKAISEIYNLDSEIDCEVSDKEISLKLPNLEKEIKGLISYFVGVLFGRYSFVKTGVVYAGDHFDDASREMRIFSKDGILLISSDITFEDGLTNKLIGLIQSVYGHDNYRKNIDFISQSLGKKPHETSEETLNRYLAEDYYFDHISLYNQRPIYWMFSSGKKNGFKCLIYMHRYTSSTLAKINASYFQPVTTILRTKISEIENIIFSSSDKDKVTLERKRFALIEQLDETIEYGQVLDYMANKYTPIDLDDGVKVNYAKFQGIETTTSNGKVKKDLLVPIK